MFIAPCDSDDPEESIDHELSVTEGVLDRGDAAGEANPYVKRLILVLTLVLAIPSGAVAQTVLPQAVRFHVISWHDRGDFSNANLGVGLRWNGGLAAGGFRNSYGRPSWYGGLVVTVFERRALQFELMAGAITGTRNRIRSISWPCRLWAGVCPREAHCKWFACLAS